MEAAIEEVNSVQKRVKVKVSAQQVDEAFKNLFQELKSKVRLKGFRPGKAPLQVIRRFYGESSRSEVLEKIVKQNLFDAIEKNQLRPVAAPVLETDELPAEGQDYSFSALVDVMPHIDIPNYKGLKTEIKVWKVKDEDIQSRLEQMQKEKAKLKALDAAAAIQSGNRIKVQQSAQSDGQDLAHFNIPELEIEVGSDEWLPQLSESVVGLKIGDEKTVTVTLPEDYQDEHLKGKTVDMRLRILEANELILPSIDDELAKDFESESLADLKDQIRSEMQSYADDVRQQQLENDLLSNLVRASTFEVPPSFVDQIIDGMIDEMYRGNKEQSRKEYGDRELRGRLREPAKDRAKSSLILGEICKLENIEVTQDDLRTHIAKTFRLPFDGGEEQAKRLDDFVKMMGSQMENTVRLAKAMKVITESAEVNEIVG